MTVLHPFQASTVHQMTGRNLIALDMGLGKSIVSLTWAAENNAWPCVVVCPAVLKYTWEHEAKVHLRLRSTILEGRKPANGSLLKRKLVIVNYDILGAWLDWLRELDPELVIVDECFPWDTPVLTEIGSVPIGMIVDLKLPLTILSYDFQTKGLVRRRVVQYIKKRRTNRMVTIRFSTGELRCTENHLIWTEGKGYVPAGKVSRDDLLRGVWGSEKRKEHGESHGSILQQKLCIPFQQQTAIGCQGEAQTKEGEGSFGMRALWGFISGDPVPFKRAEETSVLFCEMHVKNNGQSSQPEENLRFKGENRKDQRLQQTTISNGSRRTPSESVIREDEEKQPIPRPKGSCKSKADQKGKRVTASMERETGWQRDILQTSEGVVELVGSRLANGIGHSNRSPEEEWVSNLLQSGYWQPTSESSNRDRWTPPSQSEEQSKGSEERRTDHFIRVEGVEIHESGSGQQHSENSQDDQFVYCIEVEESHNFYANGILVHNCQAISNRTTQQSKNVRKLCQDVPCVLGLSGTPLTNRPPELWPICNLLWPETFPSWWSFCQEFTVPRRTPWGWEFKRTRNLPVLHERLKQCGMLRKRKSQVLKDLPAKQREVLLLPLSNRKEYEQAENDFISWLRRRDREKARRARKAERLVQMGWLKRLAAEGKLPSVFQWIDAFLDGSDEKLIVYAVHKAVISALRERYSKICVVVDGSVTGRKRQMAVEQFNKKKTTRLTINNIKAAGTGLSYTGASTMAIVELPWTPGACSQAEDRIHGIGRGQEGKHSQVFYLVAKDTIEAKLVSIIQEKQSVLDQTLDGKEGASRLDILDQLERLMKKGAMT